MAPNRSTDRLSRESRERLRGYEARQTVHRHKIARRRRDNWIAAIAFVVAIAAVTGAQIFYFSGGPGTPAATPTASATPTPTPGATPSTTENTGDVPSADLSESRTWTGTMTINGIPLGIDLDGAAAPQAVASFVTLVQNTFYNGLTCHRLTTGGAAVLQCGDPEGTGSGGPGWSFGPVENAPADNVYPAGTIAMARLGDNGYSNGSQFFIVYEDTTLPADAAGGYTVLGQVTSGLDTLNSDITSKGTVDGSGDGAPAVPTTIDSITVQ
ncbi:peptidylprolyl isomerase [Okibacterium fritillariae]|uniref:peptidylprolyl isomerase n=1 Tax=Okibacterium fritillariae TaxID=123320 RepID=UPI004055632C